MSNINIGIPSLTVSVKKPDNYLVNMQASTVGVLNAGTYPLIAVSAQSASYALVAQSLIGGASIVYTNFSASNDGYIGHNLFVSNSLSATSITGSLSGSFIGTVSNITGGTSTYIPLWSTNTTLASSIIFQSASGILINATTHSSPVATSALEIYSINTGSYNLAYGAGTVDNYLQFQIQNRSTNVSASSDFVATADTGTETSAFIDMGINGSGYINNGNGIGHALDGYLYLRDGGDLLIGNYNTNKKVIIFSGIGPAASNARVYLDPLGTVGINTSGINTLEPEALRVRALSNTYNLISAESNINSYAQINITNESAGINASSDFVATNDTGTQLINYIDMGINSSGYTGASSPAVGYANDGYLFSAGSNLYVGTINSGSNVILFAGGDTAHDTKLVLSPNNQHQLTGSLNVTGSIVTLGNTTITGSLIVLGSVSGALVLPANIVSSSTQATTWTVATASRATSASYAVTASYVSGAASDWNTLSNKPSGIISSSTQLPSGTVSSSGQVSYTGLSNIPSSIVSSSSQFTSLTAPFTGSFTGSHTGTFPYASLTSIPSGIISSSTQLPSGTISSSGQVSYTGLSNIPSGIVSSSTQVTPLLPTGTISSSTQVVSSLPANTVSSSTQFTSLTAPFTGSFTGSHTGTFPYSGLTSVPTLWSSSAQLPSGTVSSSGQVSYTGLSSIPVGIVSSSTQVTPLLPTGTVSSSGQVSYTGLSNIPSGIFSSSAQLPSGTVSSSGQVQLSGLSGTTFAATNFTFPQNLTVQGNITAVQLYIQSSSVIYTSGSTKFGDTMDDVMSVTGSIQVTGSQTLVGSVTASGFSGSVNYNYLTNVPTLISSSGQVSYTGLSNIPSGIVSSSTQVTTLLPTGTVSSSGQISYTGLSSIPVGIVSSSTQFTSLTAAFTGSFTGSFTGTLPFTGLTSVPTLVSSSAQLPSGTVSASSQVSYTGLSSIPSGIVSSSTQFTSLTAPFTGSFTGSFAGALSYANLTNVPSGIVSSSTQVTLLLPTGTVSSSGQISYTGLSNIPSGIVSSSTQITPLLPTGTVSSSTQVVAALPANTISSSTQFTSLTAPFTGSFTGSFTGTLPYSGLTGTPTLWSSSAQLPTGTVSSSAQVSYTGLSNIPSGIVSSSTQFTSLTAPFTGSFTGSFVGSLSYANLTNIPSGIVSSSTQVTTLLPTGTVSSSGQISYTGLTNIPSGIVSSSAQITPLLPAGTISSSGQVALASISGTTFSSSAFTFPSDVTVQGNIIGTGLVHGIYFTTASVTGIVGPVSNQVIASIPSSSYDFAHFDYSVKDGTNYRTGTIMSIWSTAGSIEYTDNSTNDIGNTAQAIWAVGISGNTIQLKLSVTSGTWSTKTIIRAF